MVSDGQRMVSNGSCKIQQLSIDPQPDVQYRRVPSHIPWPTAEYAVVDADDDQTNIRTGLHLQFCMSSFHARPSLHRDQHYTVLSSFSSVCMSVHTSDRSNRWTLFTTGDTLTSPPFTLQVLAALWRNEVENKSLPCSWALGLENWINCSWILWLQKKIFNLHILFNKLRRFSEFIFTLSTAGLQQDGKITTFEIIGKLSLLTKSVNYNGKMTTIMINVTTRKTI